MTVGVMRLDYQAIAARNSRAAATDAITYRQRGVGVNSIDRIGARLRLFTSFNSRGQKFCTRAAPAIDTLVQIAPDVVVTVHHDPTHGG
jgi:hypothetical protein